MAVEWTGSVDVPYTGGGTHVIDVPLPAGAEIGNTLIAVGTFTSVLEDAVFTLTDSRLTKVTDLDTPYGVGSLWVGTVTDLSNVTGEGYEPGGANGGILLLATLRNKVQTTNRAAVTSNTDAFTLPGLSGLTGGALVASVARHGIGAATWYPGDDYTDVLTGGDYAKAALSYTELTPTVPTQSASWTWVAGDAESHSVVMGIGPIVRVAPPCRLFPREDGLGVGGGRHFPPAKSQQRSGRRFGYY